MVRNEGSMSGITRNGRRNISCSFHRECEGLSIGRGLGYCDLDGSQTICDGDSRFCEKPDVLRVYLLKSDKKRKSANKTQKLFKVFPHALKGGTTDLRDARNRRNSRRLSLALPLEYWKRNTSCPQAGVSGNVSETGLLIYSISEDLCVGEELMIRVFFANGYELDTFKMIARVIWKTVHRETEWNGHKYGLRFIHVSNQDREKLKQLFSEENPDDRYDSEAVSMRGTTTGLTAMGTQITNSTVCII